VTGIALMSPERLLEAVAAPGGRLGRDLPGLVGESFAALGGIAG
jgi:hypothetical protein